MSMTKISKQFHAMFSVFMVLFYLGFGIFFLFFARKYFVIDKAISTLFGGTLMVLGLYRIYLTWKLITKAFFSPGEDDE